MRVLRKASFYFVAWPLLAFILPLGGIAHAAEASLFISPAAGSFVVGSTFTISLYVNSGGHSINAVEADLSFPRDKLQVVSPSTGNSFISTWVTQPSFSNIDGTLHFVGALPNPGIATNAGLISTVTFRVVGTGSAVVKFLDASKVLLNNGQGTDILGQTTNGVYTLTVPPPAGPAVTSPTDPDQSKWYNSATAAFEWSPGSVPADGYGYVLNDTPIDAPPDVSRGAATSVSYPNLPDGTHYFHIKTLRNGLWGGVTHYAIHIDSTPPAAMNIQISPSNYTSDQSPVLQFETTDAVSGIDHYELKVIPLNPNLSAPTSSNGQKPFFIEATSPYLLHLPLGHYDIVVRAYDVAGNYYQATTNLALVTPFFQIVSPGGVQIAGGLVFAWPYLILIALLAILLLAYLLRKVWRLHRTLEERLERGAAAHPDIAAKLAELKAKQKEYEAILKKKVVAILILLAGAGLLRVGLQAPPARAAGALTLSPPLVNLYPTSLGNDEVLYLGGWANAPRATVQIYIEQTETGNTFSGTTATGDDGNWFYSFPQLLNSGHYAAWAELKSGDAVSSPSARVNITVSPTAIQLGAARLDYAEFYFGLFIVSLIAALVLLVLVITFMRRARTKRGHLEGLIREAEESLRRGFLVLSRDIETELAAVQRLKVSGTFSAEERAREEKLRADLEATRRYIGKEIWQIEEEGRKS